MEKMPKKRKFGEPVSERARFLRFLATGGIAAGVNVGSCWLLGFVMSYEMAVTLAYLAGMTTAFVLARTFVFEGRGGGVATQYSRFALVNAVAFAQVWLVSVGLARGLFPAIGYTFHADTVAHVIGVGSPILTSYIGHKHISFS
jgi:putative flippase GtrA